MTVPFALRAFMADHIRVLSKKYDVTVFSNFANDTCAGLFDDSVELVHIQFARSPHPLRDIKCLFHLCSVFRKGKYDSVHSITPKAGLVTMIAAWAMRVPIRIHTFTGQVWVTVPSGLWRSILKCMDRLIAFFSTDVYVDSWSQRAFLVREKIIKEGKVLASGSVNGVDCEKFKPDADYRASVRKQFGISDKGIVFGFLGRLNKQKGLLDLFEAIASLENNADLNLLCVGPDEEGIERLVGDNYPALIGRVRFAGQTTVPENFYSAFDVLCIPSYREGFGSSVIEAAACGVPALASRIYGLTDAVEENVTGIMHAVGSIEEIREGLQMFINNPVLREELGRNARKRVLEKFQTKRLASAMMNEYEKLFIQNN